MFTEISPAYPLKNSHPGVPTWPLFINNNNHNKYREIRNHFKSRNFINSLTHLVSYQNRKTGPAIPYIHTQHVQIPLQTSKVQLNPSSVKRNLKMLKRTFSHPYQIMQNWTAHDSYTYLTYSSTSIYPKKRNLTL